MMRAKEMGGVDQLTIGNLPHPHNLRYYSLLLLVCVSAKSLGACAWYLSTLMVLKILILWFSVSHCFISSKAAYSSDSLAVNHTLSSNNTLVSSRGIFELGFFTPGSSLKEYVGVWYYKEKNTIIWVANRQHPVVKTPGKLILHQTGVLEITDRENATIWSSNSDESVLNPVAQLLDTGNFVVGDKIRIALDQFTWQGFDYPCDTRVTKMKIGYDKRKQRSVYESSWKSLDDPAEGEYVFKLDITGIPQYFLTKGLQETFRTGPWNGETFSGIPHLNPDSFYRMAYTDDDDWIYFLLEPISSSVLSRTVLGVNGTWLRFIADETTLDWKMTLAFVTDNCDTYNWCGPYASCDIHKTPICECLAGYIPKSPRHWHISNWTEGCVRSAMSNYSREDKFYKLSNIKVPDTRNAYGNLSWSFEECRIACLENYSCTAYGKMYVTYEGRGCLLWFGKLKDIRVYAGSGQDIFVRGDNSGKAGQGKKVIIISSMVSAVVLAFVAIFIICCRRRKPQNHQQRGTKEETSQRGELTETNSSELDLPLFDIETILRATNNFSAENKLGEGGFGPVYKGILQDGQEVAVKKLSHDSKQGSMEFKNEVMCIAKLQHRNLVKLLGCCIQDEFMLIYEFMPNKSLDLLIFDDKESALLNWPMRLNIINGIARGMLYLHQDSRLRIIHRDLKASNVLLDSDLNPKISDFGMARICGGAETAANTTRVVGTYGYMAPEYAIDGLFSIKSDVYSLGVLVLEIISGKSNRGFHHSEHRLNLLGHIWNLFNEERSIEAADKTLTTSSRNQHEVIRVIHIGLLCVQENPKDRPTMAAAVLMLSSDIKLLTPKVPGFFTARKIVEADSSSSDLHSCSANGMSFTLMNPR